MDVTIETVSRLSSQGISMREIAARTGISVQKVRKVLITTGQYTTPAIAHAYELYRSGKSVNEIADNMGVTTKAVSAMLPYQKGMYGAEYPSKNALNVRKSREKSNEVK